MKKIRKNKHGAYILDHGTQSCINCYNEIQYSEMFLNMFLIGGELIKNNLEDVRGYFISLHKDDRNKFAKEFVEHIKSKKNDYIFEIDTYEHYYGQIAFARLIDNMLSYYKEILAEVIIENPKILNSSKESEKIEFILKFETINELIKAIAEKKIEELFYQGIDKIEDYFNERLGLNIFEDKEDRDAFVRAVKIRNLIVHNRGKVNKNFLKEYKDEGYKEDDSLTISYGNLAELHLALNNYIVELDIKISKKFKLNIVNNG